MVLLLQRGGSDGLSEYDESIAGFWNRLVSGRHGCAVDAILLDLYRHARGVRDCIAMTKQAFGP